MSLFLFSVVAGWTLFQVLTRIELEGNKGRLIKLGSKITVRLPVKTYLAWKTGAISFAIVTFTLAIMMIIAQSVHPAEGYAFRFIDALTSPRIASAFFGGMVGIALGNLTNRILHGGKDYKLTGQDRVQAVLVFGLVILGIGGEEAIQSLSRRISKISVGATNEISFSEPAKSARASAEQPGTVANRAGQQSEYLSTSTSGGLRELSELHTTIDADVSYIKAFAKPEARPETKMAAVGRYFRAPASDATDGAAPPLQLLTFADTVGPIAGCMQEAYSRTANTEVLKQELSHIATVVSQHTAAEPQAIPDKNPSPGTLAVRGHNVAVVAYNGGLARLLRANAAQQNGSKPRNGSDPGPDERFIRKCVPMLALFCPDLLSKTYVKQLSTAKELHAWLAASDADTGSSKANDASARPLTNGAKAAACLDEVAKPHKTRIPHLEKQLNQVFEDHKPGNDRPYLVMAQASAFAYLGNYHVAGHVLHNWIQETLEKHQAKTAATIDFPDKWYIIRARFSLGVYLEEWIRSRGESAPLSLRQYHIDNWRVLISEMISIPRLAKLRDASGDYAYTVGLLGATHSGDEGLCRMTDSHGGDASTKDEGDSLANSFESYISALTNFLDSALKHPTYKRTNGAVISSYARELSKLSLKCLNPKVDKEEFRAEILERLVRNQLNQVENSRPFQSVESLRSQVREAGELLKLAIQLISKPVGEERAKKAQDANFLGRISGNNLIELHDTLLITQAKVQDKERELAQ